MNAAAQCAGGCQCRAATKGPASAIAALRMARSLALPPALFTAGSLFQQPAAPVQRLKMARWPLQLGAARIASSGALFRTNSSAPLQKRRRDALVVVNKLSPVQGSNWLNGQGSSLWQLQVLSQPLTSQTNTQLLDCLLSFQKPVPVEAKFAIFLLVEENEH